LQACDSIIADFFVLKCEFLGKFASQNSVKPQKVIAKVILGCGAEFIRTSKNIDLFSLLSGTRLGRNQNRI
jgi:hypothetical protein